MPDNDLFLNMLEEIREIAHEFIGDDGLDESAGYVADLAAIDQLRQTYIDNFSSDGKGELHYDRVMEFCANRAIVLPKEDSNA